MRGSALEPRRVCGGMDIEDVPRERLPSKEKHYVPGWPGAPGTDTLGCKCPPAPAFGRRLLLDFAPKGIRTRRCSLAANVKAQNRGLVFRQSAIRALVRPAALRGEIKEEASAAGRGRGTFAPQGGRSHRGPSGRREGMRSSNRARASPEAGEQPVLFNRHRPPLQRFGTWGQNPMGCSPTRAGAPLSHCGGGTAPPKPPASAPAVPGRRCGNRT
jgi:hypothetical protein